MFWSRRNSLCGPVSGPALPTDWLGLLHPSQVQEAASQVDDLHWVVMEHICGSHLPRGAGPQSRGGQSLRHKPELTEDVYSATSEA